MLKVFRFLHFIPYFMKIFGDLFSGMLYIFVCAPLSNEKKNGFGSVLLCAKFKVHFHYHFQNGVLRGLEFSNIICPNINH